MRRYVPAVSGDDADVRPERDPRAGDDAAAARLVDDFVFAGGDRMLHVLNAPSPGATSSLAIGEEIAARAARDLLGP